MDQIYSYICEKEKKDVDHLKLKWIHSLKKEMVVDSDAKEKDIMRRAKVKHILGPKRQHILDTLGLSIDFMGNSSEYLFENAMFEKYQKEEEGEGEKEEKEEEGSEEEEQERGERGERARRRGSSRRRSGRKNNTKAKTKAKNANFKSHTQTRRLDVRRDDDHDHDHDDN
ncbi:hypothetical protein ADUPG1_001978, partial [Aduncisulcus paluster]